MARLLPEFAVLAAVLLALVLAQRLRPLSSPARIFVRSRRPSSSPD